MRERFQHWFDVSLAEPRHRVSAVWFIGRGRPQEKHAPLQLMVLLAIPIAFLALWNVASLPVLWKEWRYNHSLSEDMALVNEGIEDMITTYESLQLSALPSQEQAPAPTVTSVPAPPVLDAPPQEVKVTQEVKVETRQEVKPEIPQEIAKPTVPAEIARIGQWQSHLTDEGVEIIFNVGNRQSGKLSGYLWGLATYETDSGETHIMTVPDSITSSDDLSPDDASNGEHFATKRFRRTRWNIVAPVTEPGHFSKIVVGVTDENGNEILREERKL